MPKIGICARCNKERPLTGRGYCRSCYGALRKKGELPLVRGPKKTNISLVEPKTPQGGFVGLCDELEQLKATQEKTIQAITDLISAMRKEMIVACDRFQKLSDLLNKRDLGRPIK